MNKNRKTSHILNVFQFDANGHVILPATLTIGENPHSSDNTSKIPSTAWIRTYVTGLSYLTGNQSITVSGDATGSGTTAITLTLANTAVTPGTYGSTTLVPVVTVDSKGRITSVTTAAISGSLTFTGDVTGSGTTGTSTGLTLAASGVTAGTYTKVTVDSKGRVTVGANASTTDISEGTNLYYTDTRVGTYLTANSYATQSYVGTQIANLVASAPATLDTLNELSVALGNDPNFATSVATSIGTKQTQLNGTGFVKVIGTTVSYDNNTYLTSFTETDPIYVASTWYSTTNNATNWNTAYGWGNHAIVGYLTSVPTHNQAWSTITSTPTTISGYGITNAYTDAQIQNFFNGANAITGYNKSNWDTAYGWGNHASGGYLTGITSSQVTTALGYTPYNSTNPSGYITGITSSNVTTALGYTPYNSTNPSGYITGITSGNVTTALGYTPYNSTNPSGYITSSGSISGTAAYATQWGTPSGYANFSSTAISASVGWLFGTTGNGTYAPVSLASVATLLSLGSLAYSSATIPTNNNQLTNGAGYITSSGSITGTAGSTGLLTIDNSVVYGRSGLQFAQSANTAGNTASNHNTPTADWWHVIRMNHANGGGYYADLAVSMTTNLGLSRRVISNGSQLSNWVTILDALNYNSYSPTLTGTGASGSWGISITGNAATSTIFNNGSLYISVTNGNTLNSGYNNAGDGSDIWINYRGYNDAQSYFRDFRVGDGKGAQVALFTGSTKSLAITGAISASNLSGTNTGDQTNISGTASNITAYTINQSIGTGNSPSFAGLTINTAGTGTWGPFVVTSTSQWGDGATQYVTIGAGGAAGIMINNPHIVWNTSETAAVMKFGRSGGISSGSYYNIGTGASNNFFINKDGAIASPILNINSSGNTTFSGTISASNLSGTNTGDQTNISGNAATATTATNALEMANNGNSISGMGSISNWDSRPGVGFAAYGINNHTGVTLSGYGGYGGVRLYASGYPTHASSVLRLEASDSVKTFGGLYSDGNPVLVQNTSISYSFGLNDTKLYLRTNGDNNHYLWNNASDFEEMVYYNGTGFKVTSSTGVANCLFESVASSGMLFIGSVDAGRTYIGDASRSGIAIGGTAYPQLMLNAVGGGNTTHGANISMTGLKSAGGYRRWVMGIPNLDPTTFSLGWADDQSNPHYGVGVGWGASAAKFSWDTSGNFIASGDITAYGTPSDLRLKDLKGKVSNALSSIIKLNGYRFDWKEDKSKLFVLKEDIGVIAQEVADVFPELARTNENGFMSVRYQGLTAVLIEAIKEQQLQIEELKNKLDGLTR